jgi:hypothetical protein
MRLCPNIVCRALATVLLQALAGDAIAAEVEEWMKPGNASKFLCVDNDVYSIETLQPVAKGVLAGLRGARVIKDSPGVFYIGGSTEASQVPGIVKIPGWRFRPGDAANVKPLEKLPKQDIRGQSAYLASDLRRVAYIDKGDWWRGDIDWAAGDVVNRKQVTSVGQFSPNNQPVLGWFGNYLFVFGNFDEKKPVVRIDLVSGDLLEIPHSEVFHVRGTMHMGNVNPAGDRLIAAQRGDAKVIFAFDPYSAKEWTLPNIFKSPNGSTGPGLAPGSQVNWLDDDTALAVADLLLVKIDLAAGKTSVIPLPEGSERGVGTFLPGGQAVMVPGYPPGAPRERANYQMKVLDLRSGKTMDMPRESGVWLDDRRYLYAKNTGGITQLGTYLFDRTTQKSVRLSSALMAGTGSYIADRDEVMFPVNQPSQGTILVGADGSNARRLETMDVAVIGEPIDLEWGKPATDLWDPARYKPRPVNVVSAADALAEPAGGDPSAAQAKPAPVQPSQPVAASQPAPSKPPQQQEKDDEVVSEVTDKANKAKEAAKGVGELFKRRFP